MWTHKTEEALHSNSTETNRIRSLGALNFQTNLASSLLSLCYFCAATHDGVNQILHSLLQGTSLNVNSVAMLTPLGIGNLGNVLYDHLWIFRLLPVLLYENTLKHITSETKTFMYVVGYF